MSQQDSTQFFGIGLLERIFESSLDAVEIDDIEGRILYVNDSWCQLFDQDRQNVVNIRWASLRLAAMESPDLMCSWGRCLAEGRSQGMFRLCRAVGGPATVTYTRTLCRNADNVPTGVLTIFRPLGQAEAGG